MYVTEKHLKAEIKDLKEQINALASDLGGDIRFLHQELLELREELETTRQTMIFSKESDNNE